MNNPLYLSLAAHLVREYLGVRVRFRVLGLWKTTEWRGFRDFFHVFFLTALAAAAALPLASLAVYVKAVPAKVAVEAPAAAQQTQTLWSVTVLLKCGLHNVMGAAFGLGSKPDMLTPLLLHLLRKLLVMAAELLLLLSALPGCRYRPIEAAKTLI